MTRMSIARRAAALGAVLTGALAGPASADTFCVATSDCPGGVELPGLATALLSAEANPGPDTIRLGNATFIGPYSYAAPDPLVIEGSEHAALRSNGDGQTVLGLDGPAVVSNVQVRLEHDHSTGLELDGTAVAEGVEVGHLLGPEAELTGVLMGTGTLADSHVTVPGSGLSTGVTTTGGLVVIRDSLIEGSRGIWGPFNPFSSSLRRVHVRAKSGIGIQRGTVAIEDALVEHNGTGDGGGIAAFGTSHPTHVTVRHSTVVGAGPAALAGVAAISNAEAATVDVRDSILTGWQRSLQREAPGGHADIAVAYSHLAAPMVYEAVGGDGAVATEHLVAGTPGFAAGYRLAAGSPFIDAGTPAPLGVTESTTDLSGAPRVVPGIAGAVARRDLGAFEAPTVPATPPGGGGSSGGGPLPGGPTAGASPVALELSGRKRQRLRKRLKVRATLGADGRVRATARVKVQGRKRALKLRRAAATVAADSPATLRLKASRKTRRIVARSLRSDRKVRIKVRVKATAADGRTATAARKVRIRR